MTDGTLPKAAGSDTGKPQKPTGESVQGENVGRKATRGEFIKGLFPKIPGIKTAAKLLEKLGEENFNETLPPISRRQFLKDSVVTTLFVVTLAGGREIVATSEEMANFIRNTHERDKEYEQRKELTSTAEVSYIGKKTLHIPQFGDSIDKGQQDNKDGVPIKHTVDGTPTVLDTPPIGMGVYGVSDAFYKLGFYSTIKVGEETIVEPNGEKIVVPVNDDLIDSMQFGMSGARTNQVMQQIDDFTDNAHVLNIGGRDGPDSYNNPFISCVSTGGNDAMDRFQVLLSPSNVLEHGPSGVILQFESWLSQDFGTMYRTMLRKMVAIKNNPDATGLNHIFAFGIPNLKMSEIWDRLPDGLTGELKDFVEAACMRINQDILDALQEVGQENPLVKMHYLNIFDLPISDIHPIKKADEKIAERFLSRVVGEDMPNGLGTQSLLGVMEKAGITMQQVANDYITGGITQ